MWKISFFFALKVKSFFCQKMKVRTSWQFQWFRGAISARRSTSPSACDVYSEWVVAFQVLRNNNWNNFVDLPSFSLALKTVVCVFLDLWILVFWRTQYLLSATNKTINYLLPWCLREGSFKSSRWSTHNRVKTPALCHGASIPVYYPQDAKTFGCRSMTSHSSSSGNLNVLLFCVAGMNFMQHKLCRKDFLLPPSLSKLLSGTLAK